MLKDLWKIDQSHGESRFAQLLGIWLLICLIAFLIWHMEGANLSGTNLNHATVIENPSVTKRHNDSTENSKLNSIWIHDKINNSTPSTVANALRVAFCKPNTYI